MSPPYHMEPIEFPIRRNPDVSTRVKNTSAILFNPDTCQELNLNHTGLVIWQHVNQAGSFEDVIRDVQKTFDVNDIQLLKDDIMSFLHLLIPSFVESGKSSDNDIDATNWLSVDDCPTVLDVSLTRTCNLNCSYCFYDHVMDERQDLSLEIWCEHFELFKRLGLRTLSLTGGEVFCRKDIWELIDSIIACRMRYSLLTNGTLVSEETIHRFMEGKRRLRLDSIQVSIDGSCSEIHDRIRGTGSFEKAVNALHLFIDNGFPVTVRVTVNRFNVDDLENTARFLFETLGLPSFSTNDATPVGAGCDNSSHIGLSPEQMLRAMKTLHDLNQIYDGRIKATAGPVALWKMYAGMEKAFNSGVNDETRHAGYLTACGCVFSRLAIHHDGTVTPCHMLPGLIIGRLGQDSLSKLWKSHPHLTALRERRHIKTAELPECSECMWNEVCNGGCPAVAFETLGDYNRSNTHDCYRKFLADIGGKKPWIVP